MTLGCQIDHHNKRLLWCGMNRTSKTLLKLFRFLGKDNTKALEDYQCLNLPIDLTIEL